MILSLEDIEKIYEKLYKKRLSTGIDRINKDKFSKNKDFYFNIIERKINNNTYKPTAYKEVLILKNKNSKPRCISIPSIKDRIVIDYLKNVLYENFHPVKIYKNVSDIVNIISETIKSKKYNYFYKTDLQSYYDTINHSILADKTKNLLSFEENKLLSLFIENPTIKLGQSSKDVQPNKKGIPQGISISNILGNIYLNEFDTYFQNKHYLYIRYVDDILILCNKDDLNNLENNIDNELNKLKLNRSNDKTKYGLIDNIEFLGYSIKKDGHISVSDKNIKKFEMSLEKIFNDYVHSKERKIKNNIQFLQWKLDIRITGCIKNKKRYGWVIFFCDNQNLKILKQLDLLITKLCKRFHLEKKLIKNNKYQGKKFLKAYNEFLTKQEHSKYIPNIDKMTIEEKKDFLIKICQRKDTWVNKQTDFVINKEFDKIIFQSISDIEKDLHELYT